MCLLFVTALASWFILACYAFSVGNPTRLLRGVDFNGNICGSDGPVYEYPLMFIPDARHVDYSLCVMACPTVYGQQVASVNTAIRGANNTPLKVNATNVYGRMYDHLYRCLAVDVQEAASLVQGANTSNAHAQAVATLNLNREHTWQHEFESGLRELIDYWPVMVATLLIMVVLYFMVIILMRWIVAPVVYLAVVAMLLALIGLGFFCWWSMDKLYAEECGNHGDATAPFVHATYNELMQSSAVAAQGTVQGAPTYTGNHTANRTVWGGWGSNAKQLRNCVVHWAVEGWRVLAIMSWAAAGLYFLFLVWAWSKLRTAIAIIRVAGGAVVDIPTAAVIPLFSWAAMFVLTIFCQVVAAFIHTGGENKYAHVNTSLAVQNAVTVNQTNLTNVSLNIWDWDDDLARAQGWNIFMYYWSFHFVSGIAFMTLAMSFTEWYFSVNQPPHGEEVEKHGQGVCMSFCTVLRYHLGTIAFGSLLIAVFRFIRYLVNKVYDSLDSESCILAMFRCMIDCCLGCIERMIKYLSEIAYIVTCIHSYSFCRSMCRAVTVTLRNLGEVVVINYISDLVLFLIKAVAALCSVMIFRGLARSNLVVDRTQTATLLFPSLLVLTLTFLIGGLFMLVYRTAIDTIFMCYLEDKDALNQSADKHRHAQTALFAPLDLQDLFDRDDIPASKPGLRGPDGAAPVAGAAMSPTVKTRD